VGLYDGPPNTENLYQIIEIILLKLFYTLNNSNTMNGDFLKGGAALKNGGIDNNVPTNSNDTSQ